MLKQLFALFFSLISSVSDRKSCFSVKKSISTSEQCAEHPYAGQNTQHMGSFWLEWGGTQTSICLTFVFFCSRTAKLHHISSVALMAVATIYNILIGVKQTLPSIGFYLQSMKMVSLDVYDPIL